MDLKGSEIEFESEEKMFFKKISESKYPKVAVGKLSEKEIKEKISPWSNSHSFRIVPAKILKEREAGRLQISFHDNTLYGLPIPVNLWVRFLCLIVGDYLICTSNT
ncbi:hypothetical protein Avbf_15134 [Armadillidium vulgare]|nr:hypothetical protein Avbf_15134 [Armadillidium vulgare]